MFHLITRFSLRTVSACGRQHPVTPQHIYTASSKSQLQNAFVVQHPLTSHSIKHTPPTSKSRARLRQCRLFAAASGESGSDAEVSPKPAEKKKKKRRLDEICQERHPEYSRNVLQSWISQGKVLVNGQPILKSGAQIGPSATIDIIAQQPKYVCRAGLKMEAALEHFQVDVRGVTAMDAGLSTGGFTDCLLQNGAIKVYGVDVGYGQVAEKVRTDTRVVVMERTNLRHLESLPEPVNFVSLDVSFISVLKVMPAVQRVMTQNGQLVILVKPQFEALREQVGRGGVVRDPAVHEEVIEKIRSGIMEYGFHCHGCIPSPIKGATSGNTEFLAYFTRDASQETVSQEE
ncbi:hypothetical protein CYMTET_50465 [Cymbomonas tetramitiformis]|uniref:RNA-binding S4 domain-containing protein n=1 Tax=Cymbomonas tetramitiformis TaxID=36881 RepID=A0AAE0BN24_9CHLO|nr:hypothetical protein CYMTET_50465 [Cymbomonas tetramitiformis]